jgi:hypothetical protein
MRLSSIRIFAGLVSCLSAAALGQDEPRFPSAHDDPPAGWTGPVFVLRQDYPTESPAAEEYPWEEIDFRTAPESYIRAVLQYAYEGNIDAEWAPEDNMERNWYHAPWMHWGRNGREFIHGLTRERDSRPGELHEDQTDRFQNWAVSIYNAPGGFVIGEVWKGETPDPSAAQFPNGTVSIKLLFTQADPAQVPYLTGSKEWQAHIHTSLTGSTRSVQTLRLLQIDVGVRDDRADDAAGWIFGTFVHNSDAEGATPWERMVPVGIMWGNDPGVTAAMVAAGTELEETWINEDVGTPQHLGWAGRLNGPVDNPASSCLSCHSTAQYEATSSMVPGFSASDMERLRWFRNIGPEEPFDTGQISLGYSLQLAMGIQNFEEWQETVESFQPPSFLRMAAKKPRAIYRVARDEDLIISSQDRRPKLQLDEED